MQYIIAFNTTGASPVPGTNVLQTNYAGYSYEIVVTGNALGAYASAYELFRTPGQPTSQAPAGRNADVGLRRFTRRRWRHYERCAVDVDATASRNAEFRHAL
jgi:hypothetical protein